MQVFYYIQCVCQLGFCRYIPVYPGNERNDFVRIRRENKEQTVTPKPDLLQEKVSQLKALNEKSVFAVQVVQNAIDDLAAVNSGIKEAVSDIDAYIVSLNETRGSLRDRYDRNEKVMQNFTKLLSVD